MSMSKHSERFFSNLATSERYSNKSVCLKEGIRAERAGIAALKLNFSMQRRNGVQDFGGA